MNPRFFGVPIGWPEASQKSPFFGDAVNGAKELDYIESMEDSDFRNYPEPRQDGAFVWFPVFTSNTSYVGGGPGDFHWRKTTISEWLRLQGIKLPDAGSNF